MQPLQAASHISAMQPLQAASTFSCIEVSI
jgi:hypothetical protein